MIHHVSPSSGFRKTQSFKFRPSPLVLVIGLFLTGFGAALRAQPIIPDNDSFAARLPLFGSNASAIGKNSGATFEPGEPDPSFYGERSVWWTWTAPSNGAVTITTAGSSFDTILTVFTGSTLSNLVLVAFNDTETNTSTVLFNAVAATAYQISVDGASGATGNVSLQLSMGPSQAVPANNNFANRITLTGSHLNNVPGSNIGATAEAGEPFHADGVGQKSVWWTWTAPASGGLTLTTQGSLIDTLLAVYTGSSVGNLTFVAGNDEDPFSIYTSRITCNVTAGTTYQIAVDGYEGEAGDIRLRLDLDAAFPVPANDNFANRITLSGNNISTNVSNNNATYEAGEPLHLVTLGGKSVWWQWTAPNSGGVTLTASNNLLDTLVCVYKGTSLGNLTFVAGNDEDYLTSIEGDSTAYFNVTAGTTYQIVVDGVDGTSGNFLLKLVNGAADPVPSNDNFANRIVLSGSNVTVTNTTLGATLEPGEPLHRGYYGGSSIWYRWTSPGTGFVTIDTVGSFFDTILAVYTGSALSNLIEIASDDESGGDFTSLVIFPTKTNVTYQIAVDGYDGDAFDLALHVKFTSASYTLTVTTNPPGTGTVEINPPPDQAGKYVPGAVVNLTATPNAGVLFTGWTGGIDSTNNPVAITVNSNKTVVAGFYIIPTNKVWTGASVSSGNWSDSNNWNPSPPITGDFLIFPPGAARLTSNTNDLPANSTVGSITFGDSGYVLAGNALSINQGIFCTNTSGSNSISMNLRLNSNQAFECTNAAIGLDLTGGVNLSNRTLTIKAVGEVRISGTISGTGSIIKTNSGGLSFLGGGANSYTGSTTVNQGILRLDKNGTAILGPLVIGDGSGGANSDVVRSLDDSQISSSAAVTVNSSGQLDLNGFTGAAGSLTMTGGSVTTGAGSLGLNGNVTNNASSSQASIIGNLLLQGAARTFSVADGSGSTDLLISAVIANGSGTGAIIKSGSGTLQLSGANTYSGTTTINQGTLLVANGSGLGVTNQGTIVNNNGTLLLNGVSVGDEGLTLSDGTLVSDSNNNSWSGNITLVNSSVINILTNGPLSLSGIISGSGTLTKNGSGTLTYSGNKVNTYSGLTTINQGTLLLSRSTTNAIPGALTIGDGSGGANADVVRFMANSQMATLSAVTVTSSGQLDLNGFNGSVGALAMTSGSITTGAGTLALNGSATINSASSPATIAGNLSLQGANRTFTVADGAAAQDCIISAIIGNGTGTGGIIKTGPGMLQLSGGNMFSGPVTVSEGMLSILQANSLGNASQGTVVNSNAVLSMIGLTVASEALTLAGGTLQSTAGSNAWTGNIALTNSSIITTATNTVLNSAGVISGLGSVSKNGHGSLIFSGSAQNTHSGATIVDQGILLLSKSNSIAVVGPLVIGDGIGGQGVDIVRFNGNSQVSDDCPVTVLSSGQLDLNGFSGLIGSLTMTGGSVNTDAGTMGLTGNVAVNAATESATINGNLALQGAVRTFNVTDGAATIDCLISAVTGDGTGSGGIMKTGSGTLQLSGANTYSGATTVDAGTLTILNGTGLGNTNTGSSVHSNAVLSINNLAVDAELLALSGGTLQVAGGSNIWTGDVTLSNTSTITIVTNSSLNMSGIISGNGSLRKEEDGTLIFAGSFENSYSGLTTVNQGILLLSKTTSNAVIGPLIVGDGAGGADAELVRVETPQQISIGTSVTLNSSGLLELVDVADRIGSLSGTGHLALNGAAALLSVGEDDSSTTFNGLMSGAGGMAKLGTGTLELTGNNTYSGQTSVERGHLIVNGAQPASAVTVNPLGLLGGTGWVGDIAAAGTVSPGVSPGILDCGEVIFSSNATFRVELNGPTPGIGYDQINAENVSLAGTLDLSLGYMPDPNASFTIINNLSSAPIAGTFEGLAEGSLLVIGQTEFTISYTGGSGSNDVVLTLFSESVVPTVAIHILSDGSAEISGTGQTGHLYVIETTQSLTPPVFWVPIFTNMFDSNGRYTFTDTNAEPATIRFYRVFSQ